MSPAPPAAGPATTRVLYIAGTGRSGSTILGSILGQVPGMAAVGELRYIWERGLLEDRLCGCGLRFSRCPVWNDVLARAFGEAGVPDPRHMLALQRAGSRARHVPAMVAARRAPDLVPDLLRARRGDYPEALGRLYAAVAEVLGAQVVVDSSKLPAYADVLETVPSVELTVVHLVRDPRAAAFSWSRHKEQPDRGVFGYMERQGAARSAGLWNLWNTTTEALWSAAEGRYLRLRYEDLVDHPRTVLERILELMGMEGRPLPFTGEHTVVLEPCHTVAGNPDRLRQGTIVLRNDDEWAARMRARDMALVTAVTLPLLARYRYPVRPGRPGWSAPR